MIKVTTKRSTRLYARHNVMECRSVTYGQTGFLSPKHLRYRGVVMVWTAILLVLMILLIGLALDWGKVALVTHQLHNAADAAALAGGPYVKRHPDDARRIASMVGGLNSADGDPVFLDLNTDNSPDGDIIIGRYGYDPDANPPTWFFIPADPLAAGRSTSGIDFKLFGSRKIGGRAGNCINSCLIRGGQVISFIGKE